MKKKSPPKRRRSRRNPPPGSRPGELRVDPDATSSKVHVIAYDASQVVDLPECSVEQIPALLAENRVTWVHVQSLGDRSTLEALGRIFKVHPLALEDIVSVPQRPKVEAYGDQLFLVAQLVSRAARISREQLSVCLGDGFLLTFQETAQDPFAPVRERIRQGRGRLRQAESDYLAYAVLDAVIDRYFPALEDLQDSLEELEIALRSPDPEAIDRIQAARSELRETRHAIVPLRDVMRSLLGGEWPLLTETTCVYLRDCRDHVHEAHELLEACREVASGLMDIHLSTVSYQANKTMKVLTIIATIFMPLSFLAGIYGMNFDPAASPWNMPELASPYGYPLLLLAMCALAAGLVSWFWRKGWFN